MERGVSVLVADEVPHLSWRVQDLKRFPTPILKVSFDGPDIPEEQLWNLFRVRHLRFIDT